MPARSLIADESRYFYIHLSTATPFSLRPTKKHLEIFLISLTSRSGWCNNTKPTVMSDRAVERLALPWKEIKTMNALDLLTLFSYIALNVDIIFQIKQLRATKSSRDLSLIGLSIRYGAILIILVKFVSLSDLPLVVGQGLIAITFTTYFILAIYYSLHGKLRR